MAGRPRTLQKSPYTAPEVATLPVNVPTGGWDAISPLAAMEPKYAPILTNWVPRPGWVELRRGFSAWCQNLSGSTNPVESLLSYRPPSGSEKLFAATNKQIWDVSTQGQATQAATTLTFTSNRWQYVNFTPSGGSHYLLIVNGSDSYTAFDGTNWTQPSITGVSSSALININVHKRRIWFTQVNTTSFWYLGTDAISGTATQLDIGAFMTKGGSALCMASWTIDGGSGPDDYAAFLTTRGQIVLYKGTDPTNANTWALIGVFDVPPLLGNRPYCRLGAELALITLQGVIPISQALPFDAGAQRTVSITNRIQNQMLQSASAYQSNFGWELMVFPAQTLLILNVPVQANASQVQYVQNLITGAWCQFTGWNANTFGLYQDNLYFGDNSGNVNKAWSGAADLASTINADMQCAFNYFGDPGRNKRVTMVQPLIYADGSVTPTMGVDTDFTSSTATANTSTITLSGGVYDTAVYDTATYSAGATSVVNWLSTNAIGHALAVRMKVNFLPSGTNSSAVFDTGTFDTTMVFDGVGTTSVTLQINGFNALIEYGSQI